MKILKQRGRSTYFHSSVALFSGNDPPEPAIVFFGEANDPLRIARIALVGGRLTLPPGQGARLEALARNEWVRYSVQVGPRGDDGVYSQQVRDITLTQLCTHALVWTSDHHGFFHWYPKGPNLAQNCVAKFHQQHCCQQ